MNTIKIIFIMTTVFFTFSCKKVKLPDSQSEQLIGSWKYVASSGGYDGRQENTTIKEIEFTKYGKCKIKDNKLLTVNKKYEIKLSNSIYSTQPTYVIDYSSDVSQSFEVVDNTLYLRDEATDAFGYTFARK